MYLQLQNKTWLCDLHLKTCLSDWDMNEEMKLATTTDQFFQGEVPDFNPQNAYALVEGGAATHRCAILPS